MFAAEFTIAIDTLTPALQRMATAMQDWKPALEDAADYMLGSIDRNFNAGGRPEHWAPLSEATMIIASGQAESAKVKYGQGTATVRRSDKSKPLLDTGRLRASVTSSHAEGSVRRLGEASVFIGSNLMVGGYNLATIHHYGAHPRVTPKSRGYLGAHGLHLRKSTTHLTIPARPIYMFQREDEKAIMTIMEHHITKAWDGRGGSNA